MFKFSSIGKEYRGRESQGKDENVLTIRDERNELQESLPRQGAS